MEQVKNALRSLTRAICGQLDGVDIPTRPISTVVSPPDGAPYVAIDFSRPALSDLRVGLTLSLLESPEYKAAAAAIESAPDLSKGIIIDAGGILQKPEPINITRALLTNFLWRYLQEGERLDWDEGRFGEIFNELCEELRRKSVVFHTTMPLSNLKVDIAELDFGDDLKLLPASIEELERWINRDRSLPPLGMGGPPQWNAYYMDKPGVLHARKVVVGRPRPTDLQTMLDLLPRVTVAPAITALCLALNVPISVIFQEQHSEGLMAFGGGGTSWGWSPPLLGPGATLDQEKAVQVIRIFQLLQTSPNIDALALPLRRWESSLWRPSLEDRLIDAWISLEALLFRGNAGELRFRAALRLAEFLGGPDRKAIYDAARISYDWRSVIVHAGSSKGIARRKSLQDTVQLTSEYLHSALLKALELPGRFDPDKLESQLLSRESGA